MHACHGDRSARAFWLIGRRLLSSGSPRSHNVVQVPALIVGGGPVGLYASALLSSYGVPSVLAERSQSSATHPRAHLINTRTMELLRELGVEAAVRAQTPPRDEWRHFRYCSSLLGKQIAAQDHMGDVAWESLLQAATTEMAHLSQPKLEAILLAEAQRRAPASDARLLFGYECVDFEQLANGGVRAQLRRRVDATSRQSSGGPCDAPSTDATDAASLDAELDRGDDEICVEAAQMLACDGAHSRVRRALGLRLRGPPPLQHFKSVHFEAPLLAPLLRDRQREAMLYFCFNRGAIAVLVAHNIQQGQWVAQLPFFPGLQDEAALTKEACTEAIASCIGRAGDASADGNPAGCVVPFEVKSIGSWAMSAKVVEITPLLALTLSPSMPLPLN